MIYSINGVEIEAWNAPMFQRALAHAYLNKTERPVCLCKYPGIPMYIAMVAKQYVVKRMPNTGEDHDPACASYEVPKELSGLGQLSGTAIIEDVEKGLTSLKFSFSLSKGPSRSAPNSAAVEHSSVEADGNKLGLRATLHYLWTEAGFNEWSPAMNGKRSWFVIRKYLLLASENHLAKSHSLTDILYVPEQFSVDDKEAITTRRLKKLKPISDKSTGKELYMLVIGELKAIEPTRFGHRLILKHLPDMALMLDQDIYNRMQKRFETELQLWDADGFGHLIVIGTIGMNSAGIISFKELALMMTTENWIPYENSNELQLIQELSAKQRRFIKGMRFNLTTQTPLATAVVFDESKTPSALYITPPGASDEYIASMGDLIEQSKMTAWVWDAGASEMPKLPNYTVETSKN